MDDEQFKLIDGMFASAGGTDDRENAISLMEVGVREGTLADVAKVIARRYALQPQAVIEWFGEVLNRRVQGTTAIIEKMGELTKDHA